MFAVSGETSGAEARVVSKTRDRRRLRSVAQPASDVTTVAWGKGIKSGGLIRFIKKLGAIWFGTVSSKTRSGEQTLQSTTAAFAKYS